jgi:general secretion pathway protein A
MYEKHFGLVSNPFGMTPDPEFFYPSASHREAFAALSYGINARRGFMTLVGEVGTGKTTLLNALLNELDPSTCTIHMRHTTVDREELLKLILNNLIVAYGPRRLARSDADTGEFSESGVHGLSRAELINEFSAFVNGEFTAYRPPPLILIDEAQNLAVNVLEEVRLLTNLENSASKMIQVILAGQPELERTLLRSDLRQLRQRIAVHAVLKWLSLDETAEYIAFRLSRAGCSRSDELFSPAAVGLVWNASRGSPRTINVLCDHALVTSFACGYDRVNASSIQEAIQDVLSVRKLSNEAARPKPYLIADIETDRESSTVTDGTSFSAQTVGGLHE